MRPSVSLCFCIVKTVWRLERVQRELASSHAVGVVAKDGRDDGGGGGGVFKDWEFSLKLAADGASILFNRTDKPVDFYIGCLDYLLDPSAGLAKLEEEPGLLPHLRFDGLTDDIGEILRLDGEVRECP